MFGAFISGKCSAMIRPVYCRSLCGPIYLLVVVLSLLLLVGLNRQAGSGIGYQNPQAGEWSPLTHSKLQELEQEMIQIANLTVEDKKWGPLPCSVQYKNQTLSSQRPSKTRCSLKVFRDFMRRNDAFPDKGHWAGTDRNNMAFYPSSCSFRNVTLKEMKSGKCGTDGHRPFKVAVIGDSTGNYLSQGIVTALENLRYTCGIIKAERPLEERDRKRDPLYFETRVLPAGHMETSKKIFRGQQDNCFTYGCSHPGTVNISVEYISSTNIPENTLRLNSGLPKYRFVAFMTFTEYVLRHYFNDTGFPDVLIIYPPFHHTKFHSTFAKAASDIYYVHSLTQIYLPKSTPVIWIPQPQECMTLAPAHIPFLFQYDMNANQLVHGLNAVLYRVLRPLLLDARSNVYGFLELGKISCPIKCTLHKDAVHMGKRWNELLGTYLLEMMCI